MATSTITVKTGGEWVKFDTLGYTFENGKEYTLQVLGSAKFGDDGKNGILIDNSEPYTFTKKSGVDLYVLTNDPTGAVVTVSDKITLGLATKGGSGGGTGAAVWGDITGTLADQTDLAEALAAKIQNWGVDAIAIGGTDVTAFNDSLAVGNHIKLDSSNGLTVAIGYNIDTEHSQNYGNIFLGKGVVPQKNYVFSVGFHANNGYSGQNEYLNSVVYELLDGTTGKIPNDRINVDVSPTSGSTNFVTSGTIYSVLGDIETLLAAI